MDITPVGERVRLSVAVKSLRQECYSSISVPVISSPQMDTHTRHEGFNVTTPSEKSTGKTSDSKGLLNRSNSFSRFLGRSDSKKSRAAAAAAAAANASNSSTGNTNQDSLPLLPPSPRTIQKRNSLEGGIMSMEKVKQTCVKVFGEDGQTRIVNVHNTTSAKVVMGKVLHKFGIDESNADRYCIFVGSSTNGEARALSDAELTDICRSTNRPEKERLILRKRHLYPTHEEFKRKGTNNARWQNPFATTNSGISNSSTMKDLPTMSSPVARNYPRIKRFFGERPPSEVISSNLTSFFPNHKRDLLETAGINAKRLSTNRRNSAASRHDSRSSSRNSVLPELVSVLGVDMDKFEEEEEEDEEVDDDEDANDDNDNYDINNKNKKSPSDHDGDSMSLYDDSQDHTSTAKKAMASRVDLDENEVEDDHQTELEACLPWMKGSLIGRGTFGDVYLGLNPLSGELMAVKQVELPVENSASVERKRSMVEALRREIALLQELQHENIVQYLGSQSDNAHFSIFLEYVPGGSVAGLLSSYGAFQEPLVKSFVRQILKGLTYLHGKDIVHRDIKGANVLVDNKGGVKISDFGISKKVEDDIMQVTATAAHRPSLQGSIFWMAPEVVKQTQYTRKADIWSLGCMVVEMFTGDHPFPEFSQMQAIFQIGSYTAPDIPTHISEEAKDFLKCTFQLDHEKRPTAQELLSHPFLALND
ncbi:kinase-like domain-containing protein [Halteromyces radiatus]|uniref:kinase-like domain-containing protein n=1 Tax=Halteromyces radiatus TaxID=101107 RepID=UPI00221FFA8B|nr:kinase-like domain-containing protein [Halteromyces radiatus]KAI8099723.1 kinase-like domain-containing protein [Halteromyces radiatus]